MKLYLDTNVLIEIIDHRRPYHDHALAMLEHFLIQNTPLITSVHNIITIDYVLQRQKIRNVSAVLKDLISIITLADVRSTHIQAAFDRNWNDFEDAVQHEIALSEHCSAIITLNTKDYRLSEIDVVHLKNVISRLK